MKAGVPRIAVVTTRVSGPSIRLGMENLGASHSVLLRSDGTAVACGDNRFGQCNIPDLVEGVIYTHVDTGVAHTVLLASDGTAVAFGSSEVAGEDVPALSGGVIYTEVATGFRHCFVGE